MNGRYGMQMCFFMLAESYLRGKQDLPMAIGYLNQIRERANLNPYSGAQTYEAVF